MTTVTKYDVEKIRTDFPTLQRKVHGKALVYLDNAATSQKPKSVIDTLKRYYDDTNANIHRGVHLLSLEATRAYEDARVKCQRFIGAGEVEEIIFLRGTTEAINLVAQTYGRANVSKGDEVLITEMEHHSNIVPWQMLCDEKKARLRVAPMNDDGEVIMEEYEKLLSDRTKIVAFAHVSNALGTINPVAEMTRLAQEKGAVVVIDGAQAAPHMEINVRELGCDFYTVSGHKMYGPTGIGFLYGRRKLLEAMPPWQGGGDMISSVTFEKTTWNKVPHKFEAGTPNIAGTIGLGAAIDYLDALDFEAAEKELLDYGTEKLSAVEGVRLIGTAKEKTGVLSFDMGEIHPHDVGTILDSEGIAIRTGHHCAQPVMEHFGVAATCRASLAIYNNREDIDRMVAALSKVKEVFG